MSASRRTFIRQVVALGPVAMTFWVQPSSLWAVECNPSDETKDCVLPDPPPATRFIPHEPHVRVRYSAREMAEPSRAKQLQAFRDAVCLVRNLDPDDVISWTKYVAQHCTLCAPANKNNVHYNWQFPTWHRAFLYFLERQMRIMSKNDDLRLIYWDWENEHSRVLPDIYAEKDQPLYWANRYLGPKTFPLSDDDVNVQPLLSLRSFEAFGGTQFQRTPTPALYSGPHANVHNAFADPDGADPQGDMADLQHSPRDPAFYAHHGNIDRVWASWNAIGRKNPDFGDAKVYFYDEHRKLRYILLNDVRDTTKLGYRYSSLIKPKIKPASQQRFTAAMTANRAVLGAAAMARVNASAPDFLHIRDIKNLDKFPENTRRFGIFDANPPVGTDAKSSPTFLGMASRVLSGGHAHDDVLSAAIEVTGKLPAEATKGLDLFVAPLDAAKKTTAEAIPLVAEAITVIS